MHPLDRVQSVAACVQASARRLSLIRKFHNETLAFRGGAAACCRRLRIHASSRRRGVFPRGRTALPAPDRVPIANVGLRRQATRRSQTVA